MKTPYFLFLPLWLIWMIGEMNLFAITKEEGMGGVGTAYPQSSTTANFNPAVITDVEDRLDVDASLTYQWGRDYVRGSLVPAFNGSSGPQCKYFPLGVAGICQKATPQLTLGASIDGRRISKYALHRPLLVFGRGRQGVETFVGIVMPVAAYKLNESHSFGIGVPIALARIKINGLQNVAPLSLYPDHFTNRGYDWAYGYAIRLGWFWHAVPFLDIGLYYSSQLLSSSHFHKYKGFFARRGKLELAPEVRLGLAYKWSDQSKLVLDFQYNFFNVTRTLSNSPLKKAPYGSNNGPGLGWKNQLVVRVGADANLNEKWTVRSGLITFTPFVKRKNTIGNFLTPLYVVRTFITLGLTWRYDCQTEFNIAYLYGVHRFVRGKRVPNIAFGHVDIDYENHNVFLGFAKIF